MTAEEMRFPSGDRGKKENAGPNKRTYWCEYTHGTASAQRAAPLRAFKMRDDVPLRSLLARRAPRESNEPTLVNNRAPESHSCVLTVPVGEKLYGGRRKRAVCLHLLLKQLYST